MARYLLVSLILLMPATTTAQEGSESPRLVVHLTVDQFRPDYLIRLEGEFSGGFKRLMTEGVLYLRGEQAHASTETAPGHATLLSGRWPSGTEVLTNNRGVPDPSVRLIDVAPDGYRVAGASPRGFVGSSLHDWMVAADPETRALSVSYKDRGAILSMGRARAPVFWYADGKFTTSTWYADTLPDWVEAWNANDPITRLQGRVWSPLRPIESYPEADYRPFENGGADNTFPHRLPNDRQQAIRDIQYFPVFDSLTLDLALAGSKELGLGTRDGTDLLAVSLSITDKLGHRYGPESLEMHDHLLRLDQDLDWFLDSLESLVGSDQLVVTLSADHGGQPFPRDGRGGWLDLKDLTSDLNEWGKSELGIDVAADEDRGLVFANVTDLAESGVDVDSLRRALADTVSRIPGIRTVYTPETLAGNREYDALMWRRLIPEDLEYLIAASVDPWWLWTGVLTITDHGTTNRIDALVPIIIRAPGLRAKIVDRAVSVVDLAPTIAALIGVAPTETIHGRPLVEVIGYER